MLLGGVGGTFGAPTNFPAGDSPISVAVGDFSADGRPDLVVANFFVGDFVSHELSVLLNIGEHASLPAVVRTSTTGRVASG